METRRQKWTWMQKLWIGMDNMSVGMQDNSYGSVWGFNAVAGAF